MSICADQLLLAVASPEQIGAVTHLAQEEEISSYYHEANEQLVHHDRLENILQLKPDLVIVDDWTSPLTKSMLKRLKVPVLEIPTPTELSDLPNSIDMLGKALGREEQAEHLIRRWNGLLQQYSHAPHSSLLAAMFRPGGYSPGLNTVPNAVIRATGMRNLSAELGMSGSQKLELENFLYYRPALWIKDALPHGKFSESEELYRHPAMDKVAIDDVYIPLSHWFCLTPRTERAFRLLEYSTPTLAENRAVQ